MKISKKRVRLLVALENIVGNECYNGNIQNWGPGGVYEGEGREFRFPITFNGEGGEKIKRRSVDENLPASVVMTGRYKFGANELNIVRANFIPFSEQSRAKIIISQSTRKRNSERIARSPSTLWEKLTDYASLIRPTARFHVCHRKVRFSQRTLQKVRLHPEHNTNDGRYGIKPPNLEGGPKISRRLPK